LHNAHLDDASLANTERDFAAWHSFLDTLRSYDLASQTPEQKLSTRVLTWFIESRLEGEKIRLHDYPVNQLAGVQSETADFLINVHRIDDQRSAEDYLRRLREVGRKFDQVLEGLVRPIARGDAARGALVVDTGIHYKCWPRQRAITYMLDETGMPEATVVSEVERYNVNPGQACAHKVGMMSIRAARERAQPALGARFDADALKTFHDVVLRDGALPLDVLDEQVDGLISNQLQIRAGQDAVDRSSAHRR